MNKASTLNRRAKQARASGRVTAAELFRLVTRHDFKCVYCGRKELELGPPTGAIQTNALTIDHKVPLNEGGTGSIENMVPACFECNNEKDRETPKRRKTEADQHHLLPRFRR